MSQDFKLGLLHQTARFFDNFLSELFTLVHLCYRGDRGQPKALL